MSTNNIASQISRLTAAKSALREKLIERGVNVGENETLSDYPAHIDEIPSGGEQPTLFAPVITQNGNIASWENNAQNGGFPVTTTAEIDGVTVTSPLTVTESMVGKTLAVTASAENFVSASESLVLAIKEGKISAGTYTFNNTIVGNARITQGIKFTSRDGFGNLAEFIEIDVYGDGDITYVKSFGDDVWALDIGSWMGNYKTIYIETEQIVSAEFYSWFTANTTKN